MLIYVCLQYTPAYPWSEPSWQSTIALFPKMQVLWLNTCQALSDELAWALRDDMDEDSDEAESESDEDQTEMDEERYQSLSEIDNSRSEGSIISQFNFLSRAHTKQPITLH